MTDEAKKPSTISRRSHYTLKTTIKFALQTLLISLMLLIFGGMGVAGVMIMPTNLQSGATILGLSAAMVLMLVYIMYKGAGNFRKGGYFWDPPPTMTEVEVNTIPLEAGPTSITVNATTDSVYVATDDGSVLIIDSMNDNIIAYGRELVQSPIQIALDSTSNQVIAILKKGILMKLDASSLKNSTSSLLSFNHNLDGIAVNSKLQRAYVSSGHAKAVIVYDINSDMIVKKIDLGYQPSGIAVDPAKGKVFVGYKDVAAVSVIDEVSLEMIEQIGFPVPGAAVSFSSDVYVNPGNQMVYVLLRSILTDGNGGGHELDSLYVFDGTTKTFVDCRSCRLDWKSQALLSDDGHNYFAFDPESGTIFVTSVAKKRLFALPARGGEPLYSLKIGRGCSAIAVSPHSKKAYVCYKKMLGGNSIEVISIGESTEAYPELPIARG